MGKVIAFPKQPRTTAPTLAPERRTAILAAVCAWTYVLGFFLAAPMLGLFTIAFVVTFKPLAAFLTALAFAAVWRVTAAAYHRIA
jgi:hypothetical protein